MSLLSLPYLFLSCLSNIFFFFLLLLASIPVNLIQLCVSFTFPFFSLRTRLSVSQWLANCFWDLFVVWLQLVNGASVVYTGDILPKRENAVIIGNHGAGLDFVPAIVVATQCEVGCGHTMAMIKESLRYVPAIGTTNYFQGSLFMGRTWEKDEKALAAKLKAIVQSDYPSPTWVALYPEGTRITEKKRQESWDFAKKHSLPILQNVLIPRSKGFLFIFKALGDHFDALYDVTIGYEGAAMFIFDACFRGGFRTKAIHMHIRRIKRTDLPYEEEELKKWLLNDFIEKDKLMQTFHETKSFPGNRVYAPPNFARFIILLVFWTLAFLIFSSFFVPLEGTLFFAFLTIFIFIRSFQNVRKLSAEIKQEIGNKID